MGFMTEEIFDVVNERDEVVGRATLNISPQGRAEKLNMEHFVKLT